MIQGGKIESRRCDRGDGSREVGRRRRTDRRRGVWIGKYSEAVKVNVAAVCPIQEREE